MPATSPSGSQRYDCWWVVTGTRRAETHLWPEGGGSASPFYIFHPHTHQPPSLWLPVGEGGKNRWSQRLSNQHFRPSHLACPCPSPTERIVSPWARNHSYTRDGRYTVRMRKPGQGSGAIKTAANLLCCPLWEVIPHQNSLWAQLNTLGFLLTEAPFQLCSWTISGLHS